MDSPAVMKQLLNKNFGYITIHNLCTVNITGIPKNPKRACSQADVNISCLSISLQIMLSGIEKIQERSLLQCENTMKKVKSSKKNIFYLKR